jgi:hypothetical protein
MRIIGFLVCLFTNTVFADLCPITSYELTALIKNHAQSIRGSEYCEYRTILSSKEIEVALYSVEGPCFNKKGENGSCGNMHFRYLTGIVNGKALPPFEVGKRGDFSANDFELRENLIILKGFKYAESDPMCCPCIEEVKFVKITASGFEFKEP